MQKVLLAFCLLIPHFLGFSPETFSRMRLMGLAVFAMSQDARPCGCSADHRARRARRGVLSSDLRAALLACAPASNEVVPVLVCSGPVTIQSCAIGSKADSTMSQQRSPDMSDNGR